MTALEEAGTFVVEEELLLYFDTLVGFHIFAKPAELLGQSAGSLDSGSVDARAFAWDGPSLRP
eukprot:7018545-Alexandrium_andersonii.AAC.1